ncbi:DNA repair protein REV1 [Neocloeon triangulifer]|uniref:DNA repair protein REV1 n=1 Tax=Neocloeon triangulifer TaxID=2078957 RepID=UPI00286F7ACC|nr:DNA repair protein REV1 [Neocloeon triangulifer]
MRRGRRDEQFPENGFEQWGGYMNAKKAKLAEQFNVDASKESDLQASSNIFSGISVYVNGYTVPSADQIKLAMMINGGQYHHYYSASKTKYIIASNLADAKLKKIKGQPKVVKPQWIADCVAAKKLLDFRPYLLYSNQSKSQPKIHFPQVSEFESPVKTPKLNKLKISFGETSIVQNMTSTPKVTRQKCAVEDEDPPEMLDVSEDLFEQSSTSAISGTEGKALFEDDSNSRTPTPASSESDILSQDRQIAKTPDKRLLEEVEEQKTKSPEKNDGEAELEELLDCTLVAEELNAIEDQARIELSEEIETSSTKENAPLSYSREVTALVENSSFKQPNRVKSPTKSESPSKAPMRRAGEPNFLAEFYSNSRLHHISTMGSTFKSYVTELRKNHSGNFPGRNRLLQWKRENRIDADWSGEKVIMHIDMDCFFVSVGLRSHPELRGKPVAVTHAKGNPPASSSAGANREAEFEVYRRRMENKCGIDKKGENFEKALNERLKWRSDGHDRSSMSEIASCSYEARAAGLKNGMFLGQALKLCPELRTISYDFEGYKEVSYSLYNTVASFTLDIEAVSCDEMFVDCTELLKETKTNPMEFATFIRKEIREITYCPASTGFGSNILQARMATKKAKPDGQFHLLQGDVEGYMKPVKVSDLPGVGRNLAYRMDTLNLRTCADLQKYSLSKMQETFGNKLGASLFRHCRGDDDRALELEHVRKSVSAEVNYGIRFKSFAECQKFIDELAEEVQRRLEGINKRGRCITLKLMVKAKDAPTDTAKFMGHGVCDSLSKSVNLTTETSDSKVISRETMKMVNQLGINFALFRGIGVQMTKLTDKKKDDGSLNQFLLKGKNQPQPQPVPSTSKGSNASVPAQLVEAIDEAVLAELPEDIRNEVLREYKLPQPSTSRLHKQHEATTTSKPANELTFSQIDPSFLDALPEELKMEIEADLRTNRKQANAKLLSAPVSPAKANSPLKKKRGRPKGSRNGSFKEPPKLKRQIAVQLAMPETKTNQLTITTNSIIVPEDDSILRIDMQSDELHTLVKEWVKSAPEPLDQDFEMMQDFLERLLVAGKIFQVEAVLRILKLNVSRRKSAIWNSKYEELVQFIQPLIVNKYGCKLKNCS